MTPLHSGDVLPPLRHNLLFSDDPQGLGDGMLSVTHLASGEEVRLHGFETSIARLLDGHRTAGEVVEAAGRVGLPLTLTGLNGFVSKLANADLVGDDGVDTSPFVPRDPWDEVLRRGYRKALKEGREGHPRESVAVLDQVLDQAPWSIEAVKLRQEVTAGHAQAFPALFHEVERAWLALNEDDEAEAVERVRPRRVGLWLALAAAGVAIGVFAFVPFPMTVKAEAVVLPIASARVTAPRTGTVASVGVRVGQQVEEGALLFTYDTQATAAALQEAMARVETQRGLVAEGWKDAPPDDPAWIRYDRAQRAAVDAQKRLDEIRTAAGDPFAESVLALQDAFDRALDELHLSEEAMLARGPAEQAQALRRLQDEVAKLEAELRDSEVRAPLAGAVTHLAATPGEVLLEGTDAAQVDDTTSLKVVAVVGDHARSGIAPGRPAAVVIGGLTVPAPVGRVDQDQVVVELDNAARTLAPGPAELRIRARPRPLLGRW